MKWQNSATHARFIVDAWHKYVDLTESRNVPEDLALLQAAAEALPDVYTGHEGKGIEY